MPPAALDTPALGAPSRIEWVDQLRTFVIILVVNMHACVTYSHVGGWYVKDGPDPNEITRLMFILWQAHLQSFFMGLLFLIGGFFAVGSLARRGAAGFMRERLVRLGVPTLFYMVALNPLINIVINPSGDDYGSRSQAYLHYLVKLRFLGGSGPMWFAAALLIFSGVLAAWRSLRPSRGEGNGPGAKPPRLLAVALSALVLAAATFLVRTVQPIGQSVMNMQLCYFPQYLLAFAVGVAAAHGGWLQALARSGLARRAGWAGILLGPIALVATLVGAGMLGTPQLKELVGGWNVHALSFAAWEQITGTCIALGALSFCSGRLDTPTRFARWLSARSFGVYLFHPVVLVLFTVLLRPLGIDPFFKVAILTTLGLLGSFLVADLARRVPLLRTVL
jgi:peptidoglycan/LPS O-acetylase OafA/YrhL